MSLHLFLFLFFPPFLHVGLTQQKSLALAIAVVLASEQSGGHMDVSAWARREFLELCVL
jgi:hypothetical protein